jgi:hypothetical protein
LDGANRGTTNEQQCFLMLALIILGKEFVTSKNVDVYLQPLIEKLQLLWNEV